MPGTSILNFCASARIAEGFLPRIAISGKHCRKSDAYKESLKTIAAAQKSWGLHASRQSRAAHWQELSKLAVGRANTGGKKAVASVVEEFRPNFAMKEGARDYQILAFTCVVGKVELCLTESVWRGSTKKSNTVPRPVADVVVQIWFKLLIVSQEEYCMETVKKHRNCNCNL